MEHIPILQETLLLFGLGIFVFLACHRLKIPSMVGLILTGTIAGPHGLKVVSSLDGVEAMAEIGIILLLFTIGIEFSYQKLIQSRDAVFIAGPLQVGLTSLIVFLACLGMIPFNEAIFLGFLVSISSTAVVLKVLQTRMEVDSQHGRTFLGVSIFQDMAVFPMILILPFLAAANQISPAGHHATPPLWQSALIIVGLILASRYILPPLLHQIANVRDREVFLLSIVALCLAVAYLISKAGLSLALGAFLAGLILSESNYGHQALSSILPFKDVFSSFFFISVGMLLDINYVVTHPAQILGLTICVVLFKALITGWVVFKFLKTSLRTSILTGIASAQIGEFGFVLMKSGASLHLLSSTDYQLWLGVSSVTLILTPFLMRAAPFIYTQILNNWFKNKLPQAEFFPDEVIEDAKTDLKNHLIVIGYGVNGRNLTRAAKACKVPYLIIESNPSTVRLEKMKGEPITYGDASHPGVLEHASIASARVAVIAISDSFCAGRIVATARSLNPKLHILVRTQYVRDLNSLYRLGANEVVPAELETSIEIFARVLTRYLIPEEQISHLIREIRTENYAILREENSNSTSLDDLSHVLKSIEPRVIRVPPNFPLTQKPLIDLHIRSRFNINILAMQRDGAWIFEIEGHTCLIQGDILVVLGPPGKVIEFMDFLSGKEPVIKEVESGPALT